jgi:hypothetical protein
MSTSKAEDLEEIGKRLPHLSVVFDEQDPAAA